MRRKYMGNMSVLKVLEGEEDEQHDTPKTDQPRSTLEEIPLVNPEGGGWMTIPEGAPKCPSGLEYLTSVDKLLVHQKVELLEVFTGYESANKYAVKNSAGQQVYWALEDSDFLSRCCFGSLRPFDMAVLNADRREVLHFYRDLACQDCYCCPCCPQQLLEVSAPPGNVIGSVLEEGMLLAPVFGVRDATGATVLRIEGSLFPAEFKILTADGVQVGKISKQWSLARELFTDADHFGISFPVDLDVKTKATLLGALFLIDYMYFERHA